MLVKRRARNGRQRARAARVAIAFATLAGGAGRATAHPEFSALGTNRYVTAAIFDARVDVTEALLEGTLASAEERRQLDADRDGLISAAELAAGEERLRRQGPALLVEVDGRALAAPLAVSIELGDEPRADAAPIVIERRLSFPGAWPAGARRLRVVIAREPPRVLDTEVGLVLGPGLTLVGEDRVTFRGPRASALEERAATFEVTGPPPPERPKAPFVVVGVAVALLTLGGAFAAFRRARKA